MYIIFLGGGATITYVYCNTVFQFRMYYHTKYYDRLNLGTFSLFQLILHQYIVCGPESDFFCPLCLLSRLFQQISCMTCKHVYLSVAYAFRCLHYDFLKRDPCYCIVVKIVRFKINLSYISCNKKHLNKSYAMILLDLFQQQVNGHCTQKNVFMVIMNLFIAEGKYKLDLTFFLFYSYINNYDSAQLVINKRNNRNGQMTCRVSNQSALEQGTYNISSHTTNTCSHIVTTFPQKKKRKNI